MSGSGVSLVVQLDKLASGIEFVGWPKSANDLREMNLKIEALVAAATKHLRQLDAEQLNREDEFVLPPDDGCIECTCGTVPHDKNTGLCGLHALRAALRAVQP